MTYSKLSARDPAFSIGFQSPIKIMNWSWIMNCISLLLFYRHIYRHNIDVCFLPVSGNPSSLRVVAKTNRNLSPSSIGYTQLLMSSMSSILNDSDSQCNLFYIERKIRIKKWHFSRKWFNISLSRQVFCKCHKTIDSPTLTLGQTFFLPGQCLLHQKYLQTTLQPLWLCLFCMNFLL